MVMCLWPAAGRTEVWDVPRCGVVQFKAEYHPVSNASGHYTVDAQVSGLIKMMRKTIGRTEAEQPPEQESRRCSRMQMNLSLKSDG